MQELTGERNEPKILELIDDPSVRRLPQDLVTDGYLMLALATLEAPREKRLGELLRGAGRADLLHAKLPLWRLPLGPGGPAVSKTIETLRKMHLDFKKCAYRLSAGHFILTDPSFSERERVAYLKWVTAVHRGTLKLNAMKLDAIPPAVFSCTGITSFQFNRNSIRALPKELFALRLTALELEHCRFAELPDAIGALDVLASLRLEGSPLRSLPRAIGTLGALKVLQLAETRVEELPREVVELNSLEQLILTGSKLRSLPPDLFSLPSLEVVNVVRTPLAHDTAQLAALRTHVRPGCTLLP